MSNKSEPYCAYRKVIQLFFSFPMFFLNGFVVTYFLVKVIGHESFDFWQHRPGQTWNCRSFHSFSRLVRLFCRLAHWPDEMDISKVDLTFGYCIWGIWVEVTLETWMARNFCLMWGWATPTLMHRQAARNSIGMKSSEKNSDDWKR